MTTVTSGTPEQAAKAYGDVFRASSIMGLAQVVQYGVGLVRTKAVALLLGPAGVGVVGMYVSITSVVSTAAGLGLRSSGVRDMAEALGANDSAAMHEIRVALRRSAWVTGALGALLLALLAGWLSQVSFGSQDHASALGVLGLLVLFSNTEASEAAILQGSRRVPDLARRTILQAIASTALTIAGYLAWGERAIVPVLIVSGVLAYVITAGLGRQREATPHISWENSLRRARQMSALGLAFTWTSLLQLAAAWGIRALIVQSAGLTASGMYQAAWSLSGMFASLVLTAMGADFLPRLAARAHDHGAMIAAVNQQSEIGILLAMPGIVATLALAPWVIRLAYSDEFAAAADLMPGLVLGVFGRVVSWPLGYVLVAKNAARGYALLETAFTVLHVALAWALLRVAGLPGTAWAFTLLYVAYTIAVFVAARQTIGFRWSPGARRLLVASAALAGAGLATTHLLPPPVAVSVNLSLTAITGVICMRGLVQRLGPAHRLTRLAARLPFSHWLLAARPTE